MGTGVENKHLESEKQDSLKSNEVQFLCRFQSFEVCIPVPYIFKKDFMFIYAYMSVSMYGSVPMNADVKGQKKVPDLELGLRAALSSLTQVLGTKLGSSTGATNALHH